MRKKKLIIRMSPYIKINFDDETSCYSILLQYLPHRHESDLHEGYENDKLKCSYVEFLKKCFENEFTCYSLQ